MSRAHLRCLACGSSNIIEDELYCEDLLVCVDCGIVVSDAALVSQRVSVGASDVSYSRTTAEAKKPSWDLTKGIQRVKALCGILSVNHEIQELSQSYYSKAYQHKSFRRGSLRKKEILAGCCLLVSCRLLNWPISTATISCLLDADPMVMLKIYLEMIKIINIEAPIVNIDDEMEAHIHDYQISSLHIPEELSESHKDLTKRAQVSSASSTSSVELTEDTWVVSRCEDLLTEEVAASQISELVDQNPKASSVEQCELNAERIQRPGDGDNHPLVVVKILNIETPIVNINDEMEAHSHNCQMSSLRVPEELFESHKDLTKRALELDTWVVTGRKPIPITVAAVSLSWQSLKPNKRRLKISLGKFCKIAKGSKQKPALKRITEMKKVLCTLGQKIPWAREPVTADNVVEHVEYILKQRHLALRTHENALLAESQASCENLLTEEAAASQTSELVDHNPKAPSVEQCELNAERTQRPGDGDNHQLHRDTQKSQDPAPNWRKRALFDPSCVLKAKKRRVG